MDTSDAVVLGVGAATVVIMAVQMWLQHRASDRMGDLAERQTDAAERQAHAADEQARAAAAQAALADAQAQRELEAVIVAVHAGGSPQAQAVRVFNGGRHPAARIRAWYQGGDGAAVTAPATHPVLMPGEHAQLQLDTPMERVRRGQPPLTLCVAYQDGRGSHEVEPGLQALQF